MNNTSCNLSKVAPELEILDPRGKERQCGVADTWAAGRMAISKKKPLHFNISQVVLLSLPSTFQHIVEVSTAYIYLGNSVSPS